MTDVRTRCTSSSAAMTDNDSDNSAAMTDAEVAQLWELACVLAVHDMTPQAITTLEVLLHLPVVTPNVSCKTQSYLSCVRLMPRQSALLNLQA